MTKGKKSNSILEVSRLDSMIYYIIIAAILVISLIVRIKSLDFYYAFDLKTPFGEVFNFYTYYKLLGLVSLFIVCFIYFIYRNLKFKIKLRLDSITIAIGLIIISGIISTLFTPFTKEAIWGFFTRNNGLLAYISLFGVFYIISYLKLKDTHLKILSHCVNLLSILFVTIGIFEFFGNYIFDAEWYKSIYIPAELRNLINISRKAEPYVATSLLYQQNYFGAYCSIIFPFVVVQAIDSNRWIDKILFTIGSVLLFTGTYISVSMGPWITLLIALALILISYKNWRKYAQLLVLLLLYSLTTAIFINYNPTLFVETLNILKLVFSILTYKLLLIVLLIILSLIFYHKNSKINKYRFISIIIITCILISTVAFIYVLKDIAPDNMAMLSNRGYIWAYTYKMLKNNFIIGYGPDTFYYNFPHINPDMMEYSNNIIFEKPHNMYLQILSDNGLLGLAGFMILLVSTLLILLESLYKNTSYIAIVYSKATFYTTIAYMVQGITNDNIMVIQPILYLVIATSIAISRKENFTQN